MKPIDLSQTAIRIVVLIIPGLIYYKTYNTIMGINKKKDWESFFEIILMSIICYLIIGFSYSVFESISVKQVTFKLSNNLNALIDENSSPDFFEIVVASFIGFCLAFLIGKIAENNFLNKLSNKLKINNRTGERDAWEEFLNEYGNDYLVIRDYKTGYYYTAVIELYSESRQQRELIMSDVDIYDSENGNKLYNVKKMYLSRCEDDLIFELYHNENSSHDLKGAD